MGGRGEGRAGVMSRLRLASPTTAVALGVLTLLLMALDLPLEAQIHALAASNAWELVFVLPFTLVGMIVARARAAQPDGWAVVGRFAGDDSQRRRLGLRGIRVSLRHRGWPLGPLAVLFDTFGIAGALLLTAARDPAVPDGKWVLVGGGRCAAISCFS